MGMSGDMDGDPDCTSPQQELVDFLNYTEQFVATVQWEVLTAVLCVVVSKNNGGGKLRHERVRTSRGKPWQGSRKSGPHGQWVSAAAP